MAQSLAAADRGRDPRRAPRGGCHGRLYHERRLQPGSHRSVRAAGGARADDRADCSGLVSIWSRFRGDDHRAEHVRDPASLRAAEHAAAREHGPGAEHVPEPEQVSEPEHVLARQHAPGPGAEHLGGHDSGRVLSSGGRGLKHAELVAVGIGQDMPAPSVLAHAPQDETVLAGASRQASAVATSSVLGARVRGAGSVRGPPGPDPGKIRMDAPGASMVLSIIPM